MTTTEIERAASARLLVDASQAVVDAAVAHAARVTEGGAGIDDHQVHVERVAYLATQLRAANELVSYVERLAAAATPDALSEAQALVYAAEIAHALRSGIDAAPEEFGVGEAANALGAGAVVDAMRAGISEARVREIGRQVIATLGVNNIELEDEVASLTRAAARDFARNEVAPIAQEIHRDDLLVPEQLIEKFRAQGFLGSSIPEQYGGSGMGDLSMVVITEELSAGSLGAELDKVPELQVVSVAPQTIENTWVESFRIQDGIADVQQVLDSWANGDLAGAVNGLEAWQESARDAIIKATK